MTTVVEECTQYIWNTLAWVKQNGITGNAKDWYLNAPTALRTQTPAPGEVVVYGAGNGYDPNFGHVAIVQQVLPNGSFTVSESNDPYGSGPRTGRVSTMKGVTGFIMSPQAAGTSGGVPASVSTSVTGGTYCQSLSVIMGSGSGIAGFTSGLVTYFGQSCVRFKLLIGASAVFMIYFGLKMIGTPLPANPANIVVHPAKAVARTGAKAGKVAAA